MNHDMRLISKAGKTFYFATFWLNRAVRYDAARAYDFCRTVDDIADASPSRPDRDSYLQGVQDAVLRGDTSHELVRPLASLLSRFSSVQSPLAALVEACRLDNRDLVIRNECDLETYAHGVAGNVGLIMYPILGGTSPLGQTFAADLGIAMQYTNIARDVIEDLRHGRTYLPTSWLPGINLGESYEITPHKEAYVVTAIRRILALADERYLRGLSGLHYLAPDNRFAIRVAAQCYRAIGERVLKNAHLSRTRAVVSMRDKIVIACKAALQSRSATLITHSLEAAPKVAGVSTTTQPQIRYKAGTG
jgi:phytoene synthase